MAKDIKIIGVRGGEGEDGYYLVATGEFKGTGDRKGELGFVAHPANNIRWEPQLIDSILKFGYWEPMENDPKLLEEILELPEQLTGINAQGS